MGGLHSYTGIEGIDLRFPGQLYQAESGLHYNWYRQYDPTTGRYTQPDSLGLIDGPSRYAYVTNDPMQLIDPDGRFAIVLAAPTVGGWILGALGVATGGIIIGDILLNNENEGINNPASEFLSFCARVLNPVVFGPLFSKPHTQGARSSTKGKHEKGQTRNQNKEKGDANRRYPRKPPVGHTGPYPPK